MPNYSQGKIYKIVNDEDEEIYVGSTCGSLRLRKAGHKSMAKRRPNQHVYAHLNEVGWEHVRIILLQQISCANKDELRAAEQHWIDLLHPSLNKNSAVYSDCSHGRIQTVCKDCNGVAICEHGHIRYQCKPCKGSNICEHGRHRYQCKQCGGLGFCKHNQQQYHCKECSPFYCDYCNTIHARGKILQHYKSNKHKKSYIAAYINTHDEQPTEFPFNQLVH
jgi:hypothetical protein